VAASLAPHASGCFANRDAQAAPLRYFAALTKINARLAATAGAMTPATAEADPMHVLLVLRADELAGR
jgi:hypothetical protein